MNEPLVCWASLIVFLTWGIFTSAHSVQQWLQRRCGRFSFLFQWYNWSFLLMFLLFLRTFYDVFKFEYVVYGLLSWDRYRDNLDPAITGIPLSPEELNTHSGPLVIPGFIRWISLLSPIAGFFAFGVASFQLCLYAIRPLGRDGESPRVKFLHMVVVGMPLVFIVMAMRATIRQWAVMTGSAWLPYSNLDMSYSEKVDAWAEAKAAEKATYSQDLEVAMGFQFFAIWSFGQVCSSPLKRMFKGEDASSQQVLMQLGVLGLHAFVVIGLVKTVLSIALAMLSANPKNDLMLAPYSRAVEQRVGPVFLFATVLAMINMYFLGKVKAVSEAIPNTNQKFLATRILLVIGQAQLMVLQAATNDNRDYDQIIKIVHQIPYGPFQHLEWTFNSNQARLLHSSLLCYECLAIVLMNYTMWHQRMIAPAAIQQRYLFAAGSAVSADMETVRDRLKPLLPC